MSAQALVVPAIALTPWNASYADTFERKWLKTLKTVLNQPFLARRATPIASASAATAAPIGPSVTDSPRFTRTDGENTNMPSVSFTANSAIRKVASDPAARVARSDFPSKTIALPCHRIVMTEMAIPRTLTSATYVTSGAVRTTRAKGALGGRSSRPRTRVIARRSGPRASTCRGEDATSCATRRSYCVTPERDVRATALSGVSRADPESMCGGWSE